MTIKSIHIVYPEGETQEVDRHLRINQIVDINGRPLSLPLPTHKMIAYMVYKKRTKEYPGEEKTYYFLELIPSQELLHYTIGRG